MKHALAARRPPVAVLASVLACAVAALAGCATVPDQPRPSVDIPGGWMTAAAAASAKTAPAGETSSTGKPSATATAGAPSVDGPSAAAGASAASAATASTGAPRESAATVARRFWSGFGSTQLDRLLQLGLSGGLDVTIARARLEQARGAADLAAASGRATLSAGLDLGRGSTSGKHTTSATLQGAFTPDLWGGIDAQTRAADATAQASAFDLVSVQRSLLAQIATQYVDVLALDERLRLAQSIADDAAKLLSLVERQASLGAASALDVAQQRNAVQTLQAAIPALRQQRVAAVAQLAVLVDVPPALLRLTPETFLSLSVPEVDAVAPADVVDARPEVLAAEARLKAARLDVGAARAAFLPSLSITASAGWLLNPTTAAWSAAGALLQPLLDGGRRDAQLRVDRAKAEEMLASYRQTILQVLQQTEQQLAAAAELREQERLDTAAVASAADALRLSRVRYERGASDLLAVLLSQKADAQARDALVQVRQQRLRAAAALYVATGGRTLPTDTPSIVGAR